MSQTTTAAKENMMLLVDDTQRFEALLREALERMERQIGEQCYKNVARVRSPMNCWSPHTERMVWE